MKRSLLTALLLTGVLNLSHPVTAHADGIPTHGLVTHLGPSGESIAPFSAGRTWIGSDELDDIDAIWHHEIEIDVLGIEPGVYPVSVNGGPPQLRVFGDANPDIYVDFHQKDQGGGFPGIGIIPGLGRGNTCLGGGGETGSVCKQNINLTQFATVWDISVTEGPGPSPDLGKRGKAIQLTYDGVGFGVRETTCTPEPASAVLVGSVLAGILWRRKKSQRSAVD
jgi:hypothetical protein